MFSGGLRGLEHPPQRDFTYFPVLLLHAPVTNGGGAQLQFIRCQVMEISSEVFANEVEPTGLLPMEMTLARQVFLLLRKGEFPEKQLCSKRDSSKVLTRCSSLLLTFLTRSFSLFQGESV